MRIFLTLLLLTNLAYASDTQKYNEKGEQKGTEKIFGKLPADLTFEIKSVILPGSLKHIIANINKLPKNKNYYIMINTPGGSVDEGMRLVRAMQTAKYLNNNKAICIINGMAYSMGAIIQSYCHESYIDRFLGSVMYHQIGFGVQGQVEQVRDLVDFVARQSKILETDLAEQIGMTYERYKELTVYEQWITSEEAVKKGYVNGYAFAYKYDPTAEFSIIDTLFGML